MMRKKIEVNPRRNIRDSYLAFGAGLRIPAKLNGLNSNLAMTISNSFKLEGSDIR